MVDIVEKKRGPSPPKGPAIGRGSPGSGIGIDEVSANRIWKEHCSKVEAMISMPGDFQFNPLTMYAITEKPTNFIPSTLVSKSEYDNAQEYVERYSMIKTMEKTPPEKFDLPQTTSQDYGWESHPLVERNPLFNYDNNSCEITQFAANYFALMHTTPFSKKKPIVDLLKSLKMPPKKPGAVVAKEPPAKS
ncbi:protein FAM183 [Marchantia polymorpha subsp. ruderalis]|uniref:Uncharacterized protein n=2 Tax=Marchantia polymorpha TaxID=3197 RepID=A0A176VR45_MARPO|nr:hypothetical protein AXG93_1024s1040 [Marchantia polymorpha subsp. ruderalis]PTQ40487.1 hypothetical protein MARPO_0039s0007 [Marchantia polymorpha]BBN06041.1 hypothetical protein Mp_3g17890 [Marchantia polymorpha subsp. ruderalis]|eukprot:PTQ40487.1 hypothetical protein MARPO_0039s0007 [Marchantia polymorpha]